MWLASARQIEVWDGREWLTRGSGIIIRNTSEHYLVTARHVIDEKYANAPQRRAPFNRVRVLNPNFISFGTDAQEFVQWDTDWRFDEGENDLAVTPMPNSESGFYRALDKDNILDKEKLKSLQLGHPLIMAGFPALGGICQNEPLLVSRQGVLSSMPKREISIQGTLGSDYFLLDSFAQNGFSGAPLFSFKRPEFSIPSPISIESIAVNGEEVSAGSEPRRHTFPSVPAGLVGIICGHFRSSLDRSDGGHAGLSYCVPAHRIIELVSSA